MKIQMYSMRAVFLDTIACARFSCNSRYVITFN